MKYKSLTTTSHENILISRLTFYCFYINVLIFTSRYIESSLVDFFYYKKIMNISKKNIVAVAVGSFLIFVSTIAFGFLQENNWWEQDNFVQSLRTQAIQQLIDYGFNHFATLPFGPGNDNIHLTGSISYPDFPDYTVNTGIVVKDDLDVLLENKVQKLISNAPFNLNLTKLSPEIFTLSEEDIASLQNVYLFKNEQDLKDLWYVVSSYRTRINNDADWRKDNIAISYWNIGNIRVLNPQETFSFMDEVHYDPANNDWKRPFGDGRAIMWGVTKVVGWWICGAARGINTVILPNRAFEVTQRYNHTRTYKNMYDNEINGQQFWIPGLDVAVYRMGGSTKDFTFKNIREYPVIIVMNYDWTLGWMEELFVLSKESDRGELKYIGQNGNCYSREANGVPFRSCYKAVAR